MDTIQAADTYAIVYSGNNLTVELTVASNGLVAGTTYRFKLQAVNQYGASYSSEETYAAVGSLPPQPNAPYKDETLSTINSIMVDWA